MKKVLNIPEAQGEENSFCLCQMFNAITAVLL